MTNPVELNANAFENFFIALAHYVCDAMEERFMEKLPALNANTQRESMIEKPIDRKQVKTDYGISVPSLKKMVKSGAIPQHKIEGLRGFRYFPSEINKAYKPAR
jgi:hypothetical protein